MKEVEMAKTYDYDVLYIGSGHGTFDGAIPLAQTGKKVGVIETDMIGGTCPNYGCNAKIALDQPVVLKRALENLSSITANDLQIDWQQNFKNKSRIIDPLPAMISNLLVKSGVEIINGYGKFIDKHTISVNGDIKTAEKIVIATGLHPHRLAVSGKELAHDSRDFMSLGQLPEKIAIIGSGYISMEFATIANAAGSKVTVLMHGNRALRQFYSPYVRQVINDLEKRGVSFIQNANVSSFSQSGQSQVVHYANDQELKVDYILDASGRVPNVNNIGLDEIGVKYNENGIEVNGFLQTTVDNIYASGDVIDKVQPKLTPTAIFESTYLFNLFSDKISSEIKYPVIPSVVFTSPRIAKAGVEIDSKQSKNYEIQKNDLKDDWYRQVANDQLAQNALVFDQQHHLVGVTEISEVAENSVNTFLPAIEFKFSTSEINRLVHLFPSISAASWGQI
jgi:glutathione reductase (NADPH)